MFFTWCFTSSLDIRIVSFNRKTTRKETIFESYIMNFTNINKIAIKAHVYVVKGLVRTLN